MSVTWDSWAYPVLCQLGLSVEGLAFMGLLEGLMILMLAVQTHIISCSLDGTIKVWNAIEPASPGAVLDINAAYVFPPEEPGKPVRLCCLILSLSMRLTCCWQNCKQHTGNRALLQSLLPLLLRDACWQNQRQNNEAPAEKLLALALTSLCLPLDRV